MPKLINQYSAIWFAVLLVGIIGYFLLRKQPRWREFLALGVLIISLLLVWNALRPRQTPLMSDEQKISAEIGQGQPVLLEFQSPYCAACVAAKPTVDKVETEYSNQLKVIRLNVQDPVGRELARSYDFQFTPTFIFFNGQGDELWRQIGSLNPDRVRESLQ
jgi:thiol-disulfide isomerase/thioredoxin